MTAAGMKGKPAIAALLSAIFPGLGQWYNREWLKGMVFLATVVVLLGYIGAALPSVDALTRSLETGEPITGLGRVAVGAAACLAVAVGSIIDAWRSARRAK